MKQIDYWNKYFTYSNGDLYWLTGSRKGRVAGTDHKAGYRQVNIGGKYFLSHRIIWEMHNGTIPDGMEVDHINHIRNDNRIENLRIVTGGENKKNQSKRNINSSGVTGVTWYRKSGKWRAEIKCNGVYEHLGLFENKSDAVSARIAAEKRLNFHENHGK